jgi:hypothetical protein
MMLIANMSVDEARNYLGWTVVGKGTKKESLQLTSRKAQLIPVICNCFEPLNNLMNHEVDTFNLFMPWQRNRTNADKNRLENRGMAAELQHNLDKNCSVQGAVETSSDLSSILNPGIDDIKHLTKDDEMVVCGGTSNVG